MSRSGVADQYANPAGTAMLDTKITVAALRSVLRDPNENLALVRTAALQAKADGARMLFVRAPPESPSSAIRQVYLVPFHCCVLPESRSLSLHLSSDY